MGVTPFGTASSATQWGIGPQIIVGSSTTIAKFVSSSHNVTSRVSFMAAPSSTFFARDSLRFNTGSCQTLHCRRGSRFIVGARKDYYAVLGVSKNSTKSEIETAYRKLARNYHLGVKRKDISNAYEILSNDEKRSIYDSYEVLLDDEERSLYDRYDTYEVIINLLQILPDLDKYEEEELKDQGMEYEKHEEAGTEEEGPKGQEMDKMESYSWIWRILILQSILLLFFIIR